MASLFPLLAQQSLTYKDTVMSLYNAVHGVNPVAGTLLKMLELPIDSLGRFRDCYLQEVDGCILISIYTRNGGGNRSDYTHVDALLKKHPCYIRDEDASHDSTYASYYFAIPKKHQNFIMGLLTKHGNKVIMESPEVRFDAFMNKLKSGNKEDPEVKRALEVGKNIFTAMERSNGGVVVSVNHDGSVDGKA